ncbi:MAG: hypothetical protein AAF725_20940, partial [Acidobacteriota bacterium]
PPAAAASYRAPAVEIAGQRSARLAEAAFEAPLDGERAPRERLERSLPPRRLEAPGAGEPDGRASHGPPPPPAAPSGDSAARSPRASRDDGLLDSPGAVGSRDGAEAGRAGGGPAPTVSSLPRTVAELEGRAAAAAATAASGTPPFVARPEGGLPREDSLEERLRRLLVDEARRHGIEV